MFHAKQPTKQLRNFKVASWAVFSSFLWSKEKREKREIEIKATSLIHNCRNEERIDRTLKITKKLSLKKKL